MDRRVSRDCSLFLLNVTIHASNATFLKTICCISNRKGSLVIFTFQWATTLNVRDATQRAGTELGWTFFLLTFGCGCFYISQSVTLRSLLVSVKWEWTPVEGTLGWGVKHLGTEVMTEKFWVGNIYIYKKKTKTSQKRVKVVPRVNTYQVKSTLHFGSCSTKDHPNFWLQEAVLFQKYHKLHTDKKDIQ